MEVQTEGMTGARTCSSVAEDEHGGGALVFLVVTRGDEEEEGGRPFPFPQLRGPGRHGVAGGELLKNRP